MYKKLIVLCSLGYLGISLILGRAIQPDWILPPDSGITAVVSGQVVDRYRETPLAARISYSLMPDGADTGRVVLDPATGAFETKLALGYKYKFVARAEGYDDLIQEVDLRKSGPETRIRINFRLRPDGEVRRTKIADPFGTLITIVYFKPNSVDLTEASRRELNRLLKVLRANPEARISVRAHSDVPGSFQKNMDLSTLRAQAVRAYLIAHDISPYRLPHISYGNMLLLTGFPEDRYMNNRVEFHLRVN